MKERDQLEDLDVDNYMYMYMYILRPCRLDSAQVSDESELTILFG
jgi:hypothetical protein